MASGSTKAIVAAMFANFGIAVAKFVGYAAGAVPVEIEYADDGALIAKSQRGRSTDTARRARDQRSSVS